MIIIKIWISDKFKVLLFGGICYSDARYSNNLNTEYGQVFEYLKVVSYVHSLMSCKDLRATINPYSNRRSQKIKTLSETFVQL